MGQSSSQIAPTQVPESGVTRTIQASHGPLNAAPKPTKKRKAAASEDGDAALQSSKELKTSHHEPSKERKVRRAVPQHRRGTDIKPSDQPTVQQLQSQVYSRPLDLSNATNPERTTARKVREETPSQQLFEDMLNHPGDQKTVASRAAIAQETETKRTRIKENGSAQKATRKVQRSERLNDKSHSRRQVGEEAYSAGHLDRDSIVVAGAASSKGTLRRDSLIVNPIGRPGPRRKRKPQNSKQLSESKSASVPQVLTPPQSSDVLSAHPGTSSEGNAAAASAEDTDEESMDSHVHSNVQVSERRNDHERVAHPEHKTQGQRSSGQSKLLRRKRSASQESFQNTSEDDSDKESEENPKSTSKPNKTQPKPPRRSLQLPEEQDNRPQAMRQYHNALRGTVTGAWSQAEKELADEVFWNSCQVHEMEPLEVRAATLDWTNMGPFKMEIYEAFPKRTMAAIRKFCQRRFSPYESGKWTEELDYVLRKWHAKMPGEWTHISDTVMRAPSACRDRWNHVLKYESTMERGAWSTDEEAKLMSVVSYCMDLIPKTLRGEGNRNDLVKVEGSISWTTVAQKMGGTRSAKRCQEKWQKLKRRPNEMSEAREAVQAAVAVQQTEMSGKQKRLEATYKRVEPGDVFDAVREIWDAMKKHKDKQFVHESTFWSLLASERPHSKFAGKIRRKIYLSALQDYESKKVRKAVGIVEKARALSKKLRRLERKGELKLTRAFKVDHAPAKPNETPKDLPFIKKQAEAEKPSSEDKVMSWTSAGKERIAKPKKGLSERYVHDDSEEEEAVLGAEEEDRHGAVDLYQNEPHEEAIDVQETQDTQEYLRLEPDEEDAEASEEEMEVVDEVPVSSINSKFAETLGGATPKIRPADFVAKCKAGGRRR